VANEGAACGGSRNRPISPCDTYNRSPVHLHCPMLSGRRLRKRQQDTVGVRALQGHSASPTSEKSATSCIPRSMQDCVAHSPESAVSLSGVSWLQRMILARSRQAEKRMSCGHNTNIPSRDFVKSIDYRHAPDTMPTFTPFNIPPKNHRFRKPSSQSSRSSIHQHQPAPQ
jgi:hypothetical protein